MNNREERQLARDIYEDILENGWYIEEMCPRCENYVLLSNGETDWCMGCSYTRRSEHPYHGEGTA